MAITELAAPTFVNLIEPLVSARGHGAWVIDSSLAGNTPRPRRKSVAKAWITNVHVVASSVSRAFTARRGLGRIQNIGQVEAINVLHSQCGAQPTVLAMNL